MKSLVYENLIVPYPVMWSEEERYFIGRCPYFRLPAIQQPAARGKGRPLFGRPHASRQREALARGLCDICGLPLKSSTKISLSMNAAPGDDIVTQAEPLLHIECAKLSLRMCPSLQRQMQDGRIRIRQVFKYRARPVLAGDADLEKYVPDYFGRAIGLAVLDLSSWKDVTDEWSEILDRSLAHNKPQSETLLKKLARWIAPHRSHGNARPARY